jgi:serine/threonine-protein kinase
MAITTADKLIEELRSYNLLSAAQLAELEALPDRPSDSRELAKEIVKRDWLTRYQANVVYQGRSKDLLLGPYLLIDKLGEGGMGEVYRARHVRLERIVALKLIRTEKMKSKDAISRFQREAKAAASLSHPNIVTLWEDGQEGNVHFFAMEFIKGVDLSKWVREKGPMPLAHACNFIRQAALGLQHAHERGMVHRDIKPSNLMLVAGANQIKVLDMGLARIDRGDDEDDSDVGSITREGAVMGTPDFLAPEQAMNAHKVDIRADIYSLGCSLYYLLAGQPPFPGGALSEKLLKHHLEEPKPVRELRSEVPEGLATVLGKMMSKKPENRYQTPGEAAAALAPYCKAGATQTLRMPSKPSDTEAQPAAPTVAPEDSLDVELITNLRGPGLPTRGGGSSINKGARSRLTLQGLRRPTLGCFGWALGALMAFIAIAAAVLLVVVFLNFLAGDKQVDTPTTPVSNVPARATNLDDLKLDATPAEERLPWLREEVVGVLGTHKWRHWAPVKGLAFKKDGSELASFGDDEMLRFCNARTGAERLQIPTSSPSPTQLIRDLTYSPDGKYLTAAVNGAITVYWVETGREKTIYPLPGAAAAYSGDSRILAVASGANVNLYGPDGSNQLGTLKHAGVVSALAFQPRTNLLATITVPEAKKAGPAEIKIWDLTKEPIPAQPKLAFPVAPHHTRTLLVATDGSFLVTAAGEAVAGKWPVYVWDIKTKKEKAHIAEAHKNRIWTAALTAKGDKLITGSFDGSVCIWDMTTLREPLRLDDVGGPVYSVALSPDDKTLAVGGIDQGFRDPTFHGGAIHLYDLASGKERPESGRAYESWIRAGALSHDRTLLALALQDKSIKLVEAALLKERAALRAHSAPALALDFALDDRTLFSGSLDKTVAIWDVPKGTELPPPFMGQVAVYSLALAPDGNQLASGYQVGGSSLMGAIKLWDPVGRKELPTLLGHPNSVTALDYYREGKNAKLVSGGKDGSVRVWDTVKAKELLVINGAHPNGVNAVAASPSSIRKVFVSAGEDGTLKVWDAGLTKADPQPLQIVKNAVTQGPWPAPYRAATFSPDGKLLAVGCQRGGLTLYDTGTWKEVRQWRWPGGIQQLAFDNAGKHLLSVNQNGTAYVLRLPLSR